jgi:4-hydroxybenzoate polyprenyltransferase
MQAVLKIIQTWGEMVKFSHSVFALPFAVVATFLAARRLPGGLPELGRLVLIVVCMVAARSFAMTFNRIADARLDAQNPRTASRPIPTGRISLKHAWAFLAIAAVVFAAGCAGFLVYYANPWPIRLAAPVLTALAVYSYTKRFTSLAHFLLGAVIAIAPVAAWIAINPESVGLSALFLFAAVAFWIAGLDIIYACQDLDVDRREGLFSIPARLGIGPALLVSRACHAAAVLALIVLGRREQLGTLYWVGLVVAALLLAAEQAVVRPNDLSRVNLAFFTLNGLVSVAFAAAAIGDILLRR